MEIRVGKKVFEEALNTISPIIQNRVTLPILNNILIDAKDQEITILASNLENYIQYRVPASILEEGRVALPFKALLQSVKLSNGSLILKGDQKRIDLNSEGGSASFNNLPDPEDFPLIPDVTGEKFNISSYMLQKLLKVAFAAASDDTVYNMPIQGVLFQFSKDGSVAVATDTARMAIQRHIGLLHSDVSFILPIGSVKPLKKFLNDYSTLTIGKTILTVECGSAMLVTRPIEGKFPDWESAIPEYSETARVNTKKLSGIVKKCFNIVKKQNNTPIDLEAGENKISVYAGADGVNASETIDCIVRSPFTLRLNGKKFLEGVDSIDTETVSLSYTGAEKPLVITSTEQDGYLYCIMPIRK